LVSAIGVVAAAAAGTGWSAGVVEAGNPSGTATINVYVTGADAVAVAGAATPTTTGSLVCTSGFAGINSAVSAQQSFSCTGGGVATETIGITGVPANALVSVFCTPDAGQPDQVQPGNLQSTCSIYVDIPTLIVDKIVDGGGLTASDFTVEVYDSVGVLVTSTNDPDPLVCPAFFPDSDTCSIVALDAGSYQLGEVAEYGYAVDNVGCVDYPLNINEQFGGGVGEFSIGGVQEAIVEYCEVTNRYYEGNLIVQKVVVNDDGGVATAADFIAEVYEEDGGALALSEQCIADGSCLDADLGIGTYRIGETGPTGYTATVACVETQEPDGPPPTGTTPPTLGPPPAESLPGDAALAEILPFNQVTCTITNDDVPQPTTTTTTTTTTTLAPTTTALGAAAGTLPATGTSANANSLMAMIAMVLLASGGALLVVRRRIV
jgi:LPXTG-motif cell wall-anchored protein